MTTYSIFHKEVRKCYIKIYTNIYHYAHEACDANGDCEHCNLRWSPLWQLCLNVLVVVAFRLCIVVFKSFLIDFNSHRPLCIWLMSLSLHNLSSSWSPLLSSYDAWSLLALISFIGVSWYHARSPSTSLLCVVPVLISSLASIDFGLSCYWIWPKAFSHSSNKLEKFGGQYINKSNKLPLS